MKFCCNKATASCISTYISLQRHTPTYTEASSLRLNLFLRFYFLAFSLVDTFNTTLIQSLPDGCDPEYVDSVKARAFADDVT